MIQARRCPRIAPGHPSDRVPPDHVFAPVPGDCPSARIPRDDDAAPLQGPSGTDAASAQGSGGDDAGAVLGERERAVYNPRARVFYDASTGALLADEVRLERASEVQRDKACARLASVRRAEGMIALGIPRRDVDAAAAKEAGIASGALGRWL